MLLLEMAIMTTTNSEPLVITMERGNTVQKAVKHPLVDVPEGKLGNYCTCQYLSLFIADI
jgi:hypothetical protein